MIKKLRKIIAVRLAQNDWAKYAAILQYSHPHEIRSTAEGLALNYFGIEIVKGEHLSILQNYALAKALKDRLNAVFKVDNHQLTILINSLELPIQTPEDLYILNEIWVNGCYNYHLPPEQMHFVIDIGMNVGFASLFFSRTKHPLHIFSFEPFAPTYHQAMINIKRNGASGDITTHNFGLGNAGTFDIEYSETHRGRMGIWGTKLVGEQIHSAKKERIEVRSFTDSIDHIVSKYPTTPVVLKVDCEGAEYDIFEGISNEFLDQVIIVMMEWHVKGPKPFIHQLAQRGFMILSEYKNNPKAGMLYAFKQR
ncbi:MAG: FkbM family methyltransferase [Marinoscillum sp.]|uniref:FkbM family methyltransferase n=1 Tax=Marinoscillum sp. TaxID=2024838 RepID=UPI0032FD6C7B